MEGSGRNGGMEGAREEGGGAIQTTDYLGNFVGDKIIPGPVYN